MNNRQSFIPAAWEGLETARGAYAAAKRAKSPESRAYWFSLAITATNHANAAFVLALADTKESAR
jgi:hypothetical protein